MSAFFFNTLRKPTPMPETEKKHLRVIAITNQKGGCGKTTTAINLAACLGESGKRVLLIDLDPQSHATLGLNINSSNLPLTIFDVLTSNKKQPVLLSEVIIKGPANVDVAPADINLSSIERLLAEVPGRDNILHLKILALAEHYDLVIIDCPPTIGVLTFNALRACQEVIVPIEPSFFSMHGLGKLVETIEMFKETLSHEITIRALATIYDRRTSFARGIIKNLTDNKRLATFNTLINVNVKLKEAASRGLPITAYDKTSSGYRDYMALAQEVIDLGQLTKPATLTPPEQQLEYPVKTEKGVIFTYRNLHAHSVRITGDFNDWNAEGEELHHLEGTGFFRKEVNLTPGRYRYKLIVDDEWIPDPGNSKVIKSPMGDLSYFEYIK